jgi:hypothetical protein
MHSINLGLLVRLCVVQQTFGSKNRWHLATLSRLGRARVLYSALRFGPCPFPPPDDDCLLSSRATLLHLVNFD